MQEATTQRALIFTFSGIVFFFFFVPRNESGKQTRNTGRREAPPKAPSDPNAAAPSKWRRPVGSPRVPWSTRTVLPNCECAPHCSPPKEESADKPSVAKLRAVHRIVEACRCVLRASPEALHIMSACSVRFFFSFPEPCSNGHSVRRCASTIASRGCCGALVPRGTSRPRCAASALFPFSSAALFGRDPPVDPFFDGMPIGSGNFLRSLSISQMPVIMLRDLSSESGLLQIDLSEN